MKKDSNYSLSTLFSRRGNAAATTAANHGRASMRSAQNKRTELHSTIGDA